MISDSRLIQPVKSTQTKLALRVNTKKKFTIMFDAWKMSKALSGITDKIWISVYNSRTNSNPAKIYLFKVNNRNIRKRCEIRSKLTTKTTERRGVFIINFEHNSYIFLVFLLLILNRRRSGVFVVNFEHYFIYFSNVPTVDFEQTSLWYFYC